MLMLPDNSVPFIEPYPVTDDFVQGVCPLEQVGPGIFRVPFYVYQREDGEPVRAIVRKLIMPYDARPAIRAAFAAFFGERARGLN